MRCLRVAVAAEPAVRARLSSWLTKLGHLAVAVEHTAELVAVCRGGGIDLVLSDGLAAAEGVRRQLGTPVVLLSDDRSAEQRSRARAAGAFVLNTPLLLPALVAVVEEAGRRADRVPAGV